jgi:hypothetical protein
VREERDEYVLWHGSLPAQRGSVTRVRLRDVEGEVAAARAWFRERERETFEWVLGDLTTPHDLRERLLALGAEAESVETAMALTAEPQGVAAVEAREIETFEEFVAYRELQSDEFGKSDELREAVRARHEKAWEEYTDMPSWRCFAAFVDGTLAAVGGIFFTPLGGFLAGGTTRAELRGRGAYRAVVRARWDEAARRGVPVLAVQASEMSRPILERVGFRPLGRVHVLLDHAD